jgi:oligopeptide/dipeptide ABC transporter ATP-binding protein
VPEPVLEVRDLSVEYAMRTSAARAVESVSLELSGGEFLAVVGESGCGKSTLLFALAGLLSAPAAVVGGSVVFRGHNMVELSERQLRTIRWSRLSVVMQSAMNALNPVKSIAAQFEDVMRAHERFSREQIEQRSREVMRLVGISPVHLRSYPHQLSGGMRQRAMIAMALLLSPELVVMDEPTSALDVVGQRSLMVQIKELQRTLGFAVIFVTHDMSLVRQFADRLLVMYAGQVVESGPTARLFGDPLHPYTRGLLEAFPSLYGPRLALEGIAGNPPDLARLPPGCSFEPRCPEAFPACAARRPPLYRVGESDVRCLLYAEGAQSRRAPDGAPDGAPVGGG